MTVYYTNANAPGEVTELEKPSTRLDALDNWTRHNSREAAEHASDPARGGLVVRDGVLSRAGMAARRPSIVAPDDEPPVPLVVINPDDEPPLTPQPAVRPADKAPTSEWEAYAVSRGADPAEAKKATRAELIERYGKDGT